MKFLKHTNCVYFILALLAATSVAICMAVAVENGFDPLVDYQTFFYSTSFGAFSAQSNKCVNKLISANTATVTASCPYGKINGSVVLNYWQGLM